MGELMMGTMPTHDEAEFPPERIAAFIRDVDDARDESVQAEFDHYGGTLPYAEHHWRGPLKGCAQRHGIPWGRAIELYEQARREGRTHTRLGILKASA